MLQGGGGHRGSPQGLLLLLPSDSGSTPLLPRTLIHGDKKGGFTIFWADDGLDTGDLLLQKECEILPDDTVSTLYSRFLFPEGVKGMVRLPPGPPHPTATPPRPAPACCPELARILEGENAHFRVSEAGLGHIILYRRDSCLQLSEQLNKL